MIAQPDDGESAAMFPLPAAIVNSQTTGHREPVGDTKTLAIYAVGVITKPSPGKFNFLPERSWQTNGTGWGRSAEYRARIRGRNYGGLLFSDTPTNSTLYLPKEKPFTWPIQRYEFDVLWTYEFAPFHDRVIPYITSGAGAIALNGGSTESGWDRQAAVVGGAGSDLHLWGLVSLRAGFTIDWLKASTYSDRTYHSARTVVVEPRVGLVWGSGSPRPR